MLFGTSGIRGLYGSEVTESLAMRITNLFADCDVAVARDTRTTGESLAFSAISGALGKGNNVRYIGIAPTPTLAFATKKNKCCGIMVTASHNPPEYNGLKLYRNGMEIGRAAEQELEKAYGSNEKMEFSAWDKVGKVIDESSAVLEHAEMIKELVNGDAIAKKKPKVVVDCNGAGAVITPMVLRELGCEVIEMNSGLSGFSRPSEPNVTNLKWLSAKILETKADLGIGHDGDADRTAVLDEKGEMLALDVQLALMMEHQLGKAGKKGRKTVVSTVEASLCVRNAAEAAGAEIEITPVGSNFVSEVLDKKGAVFGGEPCGEYVFSEGLHVPDGILTAAKFVEIFSEKGKLSELGGKYRPYPMLRDKFPAKDKYGTVEKAKADITSKKWDATVRADDGIRVDEKDGWFLIRASGTEPFVRLTMEYKNPEILNKKADELSVLIRKYL
jgi:phosphoglucosamine mutase